MYEELIKRLRECTAKQNGEKTLWHQAADAIEDLQNKLQDSENDNINLTGWLAEEHAKHLWIPLTERLPDYGEVVQITDGIEVGHGYLEGVNTTVGIALLWHSPFCDIDEEHITHWMPLPQPPESEKA